jgi:hypothetical protein
LVVVFETFENEKWMKRQRTRNLRPASLRGKQARNFKEVVTQDMTRRWPEMAPRTICSSFDLHYSSLRFRAQEAHRRPEMKAEMSDRVSFRTGGWMMGSLLYVLPSTADIVVQV